MDYSTLITPVILVSIYFIIGLGGFFLSKRAGHTNIVNDEPNKDVGITDAATPTSADFFIKSLLIIECFILSPVY